MNKKLVDCLDCPINIEVLLIVQFLLSFLCISVLFYCEIQTYVTINWEKQPFPGYTLWFSDFPFAFPIQCWSPASDNSHRTEVDKISEGIFLVTIFLKNIGLIYYAQFSHRNAQSFIKNLAVKEETKRYTTCYADILLAGYIASIRPHSKAPSSFGSPEG